MRKVTPKVTKHAPGAPGWADLATNDDRAAVTFYGTLFNWADDPQEMGPDSFYHIQRIDGQLVVGIYTQGEQGVAQDVPPH